MGKISVVGIGPGNIDEMTIRAKSCLDNSDIIIGYKTYVDLIKDYFPEKNFLATGMTKEIERCNITLEKALSGKNVALISSGDSGIYGMAGLMIEVVNKCAQNIEVEVIPGVTALSAAAACLGAPLMHDFAVISLSDLLTSWELIEKRLISASHADFVTCIYNPKSKNRSEYIQIAQQIFLKDRSPNTPVGIVRNAGRKDETISTSTLEKMFECEIDMFTVVIIGNSNTYIENGKIITPRGYNL